MKKQNKQKGITLVALVITIIVLLILAGITISLTVGQDGIITRAQEAGKNYIEAAKNENTQLKEFTQTMADLMDNVTLIYTKEDLEKFRDEVNAGDTYAGKTVKLMADIDLKGNVSNQWIPIKGFNGTFDGNNHSIKNMYIDTEEYASCSFMGDLEPKGIIKHLKLENIYINQRRDDWRIAAGMVQYVYGKIEECSVSGTITTTSVNKSKDYQVGGIAVRVVNGGSINNCYSNVTITGGKYYTYAGGIAGIVEGKIFNCYNIGDIMVTSGAFGGITGSCIQDTGKIINCYNIGKIEGTDITLMNDWGKQRASVAGKTKINLVTNCYYLENSAEYLMLYNLDGKMTGSEENKLTSDELKEAYTLLGEAYIKDENNINQGYPILKWQTEK